MNNYHDQSLQYNTCDLLLFHYFDNILPNNFICPLCGRGKDDFDPIFKEEIEN